MPVPDWAQKMLCIIVPKEETPLMFSGKEVDFARSLFDKQHDFNGTEIEVNKIRQSFYLSRHAQLKFAYRCLQEAREIGAVRSRFA